MGCQRSTNKPSKTLTRRRPKPRSKEMSRGIIDKPCKTRRCLRSSRRRSLKNILRQLDCSQVWSNRKRLHHLTLIHHLRIVSRRESIVILKSKSNSILVNHQFHLITLTRRSQKQISKIESSQWIQALRCLRICPKISVEQKTLINPVIEIAQICH